MKAFYKYLQVNQGYPFRDLVVVNAGHTVIKPGTSYPLEKHPSHHLFSFTQGRTIDEYQLVYITEGKGVVKTVWSTGGTDSAASTGSSGMRTAVISV